MKRDAMVLEAAGGPAPVVDATIHRTPSYIGTGDRALFAWYHEVPMLRTDCVAVICPPVGSEYTRSHRSLRHLADRLARVGIPALRFDYHGMGDSPGTDLDPRRVETWRENVLAAIAHARALSGSSRVFLAGVRLGATLAALATAEADVERLVLWNPCVKGSSYARELRAIALSAQRQAEGLEDAIECAGFAFTSETLASIAAIELSRAQIRVRDRALVLGRDDAAPDRALNARLDELDIANEYRRAPGWAGMMAEHQFTVVPDAALDLIVGWLSSGVARRFVPDAMRDPGMAGTQGSIPFRFRTHAGDEARIEESLCRFGADGNLFGVLARPDADASRPAVVVFNAGAAHHVGPNRLYVELTRNLAAMGFACLRFDLESLGDSVNRRPARENYPYPHGATADGRSALEYLRDRFGYGRFVALGLCSGAHTVFHLGLEAQDLPLEEIVMINPMQFYWVEGMSLDTSRKFEDMVQYRRSMRDPRRWLKLARGDVNVRRLVEVLASQSRTYARAWADALAEAVFPRAGPRLSRDLRRLFAMERRLALFVSEGDPGRDILMAGAKLTATRALRDGRIRLQMIPEADHTFSQWKPRRDMVGRVLAHLRDSAAARDAASSYSRNGAV
ncbi:MAG TPA: alpha/beta hydrolase [Usitatibacter sp.]|jgi:alpha-beta hydrolase superfamily lysophospholipase|nr:alpha/beta hydrolase [Usitatibacter sp.]